MGAEWRQAVRLELVCPDSLDIPKFIGTYRMLQYSKHGKEVEMLCRAIASLCACTLMGCSGGGDSADHQVPVCREYASSIAVSGETLRTTGFPNLVLPANVECAFNAEMVQLSCQVGYLDNQGKSALITKAWTYGSVNDFVNEARLLGRVTSQSYASKDTSLGPLALIPDFPIQGLNRLDSAGKLISSNDLIFSDWDTGNRPIATASTSICTGDQGHRYVYDQSQRTVSQSFNTRTSARPPDGSVPCIPVNRVTKFDALGNVTDIDDVHYQVVATKLLCI
jgi:hypothetical protein